MPNSQPASPTIALLSDFGHSDVFAGVMKGVIRSIAPHAALVDLTHLIPPQSERLGAWQLSVAAPYFPEGSIFLAVVDPGVGTGRRGLVARCHGRYFVAPDNGLLSFVLDETAEIVSLENPQYALPTVSATFHGRDLFAPAAAHLACGVALSAFGPAVHDPARIEWPRLAPAQDGCWRATILAIDRFGNAVVALAKAEAERQRLRIDRIEASGRRIVGIQRTYGDAAPGGVLAYWGSSGLLEIAVRDGNAAQELGLRVGRTVRVFGVMG